MKVLITGGSGFIGSHLVETLLERGEKVIVYSRDNAKMSQMRVRHLSNANLILLEGDVTDREALVRTVASYKPNIIVHLAAITGIKRCADLPSESFHVNVYGTFSTVMAAMKSNAKLVFASSREVYGETMDEATSEDSPLLPNNLYGLTKLLGEQVITWASRRYGLRYTILRLTNVYGFGGDRYGVQIIIQKALDGEEIHVFGGNQIMNFVHVDDVVRAFLAVFENEKSTNQIFNVGSYDNVEVSHLVRKIVMFVGRKVRVKHTPYRETETMFFRPDLSKITKVLNWKPLMDLDTGLLSTIEAYKRFRHF